MVIFARVNNRRHSGLANGASAPNGVGVRRSARTLIRKVLQQGYARTVLQRTEGDALIQRQEEPEGTASVKGDTPDAPVAAPPPPEAAAEGSADVEPCALETFSSNHFTHKTPVIDVEFKDSMETVDGYAKSRGVTVYVTDSFREADATPSGAIVTPATKSNHKAGHAIDMNVKEGVAHYNSEKLKKSTLESLPEAVKGFIQDIRDDTGLRWGGDFSDEDPVHIDDHLNADSDAWQKRFDATQAARKSGCG